MRYRWMRVAAVALGCVILMAASAPAQDPAPQGETPESQQAKEAVRLYELGTSAKNRGQNQKALDLLTKSIALAPDYYAARINRAGVLRELGRFDASMDDLAEAERIAPGT